MANVKISGLTAAASAVGTHEYEVNEALTSKKVTGAQLATYVKSTLAASDITTALGATAVQNATTSASCSGTATTATTANALNTANAYTVNGSISGTGYISMQGYTGGYAITARPGTAGNGAIIGYTQNSTLYGILGYANAYGLYANADVYTTANVTAYSDERVKTNWRPLDPNFVQKLASLKSGVYDRTDVHLTQVGVGAQSLQAFLPEAISVDNTEGHEGQLSVAYGNAAMVACVELAKEVMKLKEEIEALKK